MSKIPRWQAVEMSGSAPADASVRGVSADGVRVAPAVVDGAHVELAAAVVAIAAEEVGAGGTRVGSESIRARCMRVAGRLSARALIDVAAIRAHPVAWEVKKAGE